MIELRGEYYRAQLRGEREERGTTGERRQRREAVGDGRYWELSRECYRRERERGRIEREVYDNDENKERRKIIVRAGMGKINKSTYEE